MKKYILYLGLIEPDSESSNCLIRAIKEIAFEWWFHSFESIWIITSTHTAVQIKESLSIYLSDEDDSLIVAEISNNFAWSGLSKESENWLKNIRYRSTKSRHRTTKRNLSIVTELTQSYGSESRTYMEKLVSGRDMIGEMTTTDASAMSL